ncbi:hypothetical protein [Ramlibacter albus]|uniref:Uncharacterized protein n=1 Tax=Ramlibacter albus TaxID=2079448 RepID=A0A923MF11_9BURK|nr:hypothetical protein [Ramlibacter albus]MBC5768074.1 hypothetical protein [Ramlibacter albus]
MRLPRNLILSALVAAAPATFAGGTFDGLWCGQGLLNDFSLKLKQLGAQQVEGTLMRRDRVRTLEGSISGNTLRTQATKYGSLVLEATGGELKIMGGDGPLALARGNAFKRASGGACTAG